MTTGLLERNCVAEDRTKGTALIAYDVQNSALVRAAEMNESPVQAAAATSATFTKGIVTAVRTQGGNLKVIAYETNVGSGFISRRGNDSSGAVKTVAVTTAKAFEGVVTASRSGDDKLRIETFEVGPGGFFVNKVAQVETATTILDASVAWLGERADGSDLVLTAARRTDGTLWVVAWSISPAGSISLLDTAFGGEISGVSIARYDADHAITGMTDSQGELELIAWHVTANGTLVRRAEAEGGTASKVSVADAAPFYYGGPNFTTTALRDGSGNVRLIDWQVLLTD